MTNSDLVIQVPFKEQAEGLIAEFNRSGYNAFPQIVHGSLSDTYGVAINFSEWFMSTYSFTQVIIGGEIYNRILGESWENGRYLEAWINESGRPEVIEIPYTELLTKGGKYYVSDVYLDIRKEKIYYCNYGFDNLLMTTTDIEMLLARDNFKITPGILEGIEKLCRRGFLSISLESLSVLQERVYGSTRKI